MELSDKVKQRERARLNAGLRAEQQVMTISIILFVVFFISLYFGQFMIGAVLYGVLIALAFLNQFWVWWQEREAVKLFEFVWLMQHKKG